MGNNKKFPNYDGIKSLLEFRDWCEDNNISLIITYPTIIYFKEYEDKINLIKYSAIEA